VLRLVYKKKGLELGSLKGGEHLNNKLRAARAVIEPHKCRNPNFKIIE
jgi:hypothetical protein